MSIYKHLDAKRDIKEINYFTIINLQQIAKRGKDVTEKDIIIALYDLNN